MHILNSSEQVTSGMVISTFLSAPIMYASAWLLTMQRMDPQVLMSSLQSVSFDISIVSLVLLVSHGQSLHCDVYVLVVGQSFLTDFLV